jgi:nucleotide-binding universal stress UspA family protein
MNPSWSTIMSRTIIAGVDGREGGRDAAALAARLAGALGARLVMAHAYPYDDTPRRGALTAFREALREEAIRVLAADRAALAIEAELVAVPDVKPARALHHLAEREDALALVVGSSHHGAMGRVLLGDAASGALHGAPCPVVIAPRGWADGDPAIDTIGVGYDGTAEATDALHEATVLARALGARLGVMEVVEPPQVLSPSYAYAYDWSELVDRRREEAEAGLAEVVAALDVAAGGEVVVGLAREELEALSTEVDLLVLGSRDFGPVRRVMVGSTSSWLVHHARCPVLVQRRGLDAPAESAPRPTVAPAA